MNEILRINMSQLIVESIPVNPKHQYLGGRGLIAHFARHEIPPSCHPLGGDNRLIFATGPFAGTRFPSAGRVSIGGKSPLTGGIKESNVGGTLGWNLGRLGIRAVVIHGRPADPEARYFIHVSRQGGRLIGCNPMKNKGTYETVRLLMEQFGSHVAVALIGPAGEMRLPAAALMVTDTEKNPADAAGRGGMGAVMGSMGIKALVVDSKGSAPPRPKDETGFHSLAGRFAARLSKEKGELRKYGTPMEITMSSELGYLPTRNFQTGRYEKADAIGGEKLRTIIQSRGGKGGTPCMPGCPIRCKRTVLSPDSRFLTAGLEYETIAMMGSNLDIDDLDAIGAMDRACDDLGLDTMETGATLGVLAEAGVFPFGDAKAVLDLLDQVGRQTPMGRIVGSGAETAGRLFGSCRVPAVKGQSMAGYDPRANQGIGVTYATSPMGADHTAGCVIPGRKGFDRTAEHDLLKPDGQARLSLDVQTMVTVFDNLGICFFTGVLPETLDLFARALTAFSGGPVSTRDLIDQARRTLALEIMFNRDAGISPVSRLPEFMEKEPLPPHGTVFKVKSREMMDVIESDIFQSEYQKETGS